MNQNQDVKNECGPDGRGHMNPYLAGFLLGMVLFLSFITLGAGLGASGGLARIAAWLEGLAFKSHAVSYTHLTLPTN